MTVIKKNTKKQIELIQEAVRVLGEVHSGNAHLAANLHANLGALYHKTGRMDLAKSFMEQGVQLMEDYGLTQEQVAERMGKSRPAVTNTLRLLTLTSDVLAMLEEGTLSAGHARALLSLPTPELQMDCAKRIIAEGLSVRQTEALVKAMQKVKKEKPRLSDEIALYIGEAEKNLSGHLGRKVRISHKGKKGRIELEYYNTQDLETLLSALEAMGGGGADHE